MRRSVVALFGCLGAVVAASLFACSDANDADAPGGAASSSSGDANDASVSTSSSSSSSGGDAAPLPSDSGPDADVVVDAGPYDGIHFVGRFDFADPQGPRFEWSGASIVTTFVGTGISIRLAETLIPDGQGEHTEFRVTLDGVTTSLLRLSADTDTYTLATGLPAGEHVVEVFRRSEALFSTVQFLGFAVEGGTLVPSEYPFMRRMEFVGDSITAGYGNEGNGAGAGCDFSALTENGAASFAAVTARNLNAAYSAVAWSGRGLRVNFGDAPVPTMPSLYGRTRPSDTSDTWDFSSYVADVVVVYLGTNDTWSVADPGTEFTSAYVTFLARVRSNYPAAHIFAVAAPERGFVVTRVQDAVNERMTSGDPNVHFFQFDDYDLARDGVGCNGHPSVAAHAVMATKLTAAIRGVTGW